MSGRKTLLLLTTIFLHLSPQLPTRYYTMSHVAVHATGGTWSDHCDFDVSCWMLCRLVSGSLHSWMHSLVYTFFEEYTPKSLMEVPLLLHLMLFS